MKIYINAIFLSLFLQSAIKTVYSQTQPWQRINPVPSESSISDVAILPDGRIIADGTVANILISDDLGENRKVKFNPVNSMV